ncbi:hypothetical protein GCM10009527_022820 [Actinomadura nitritigenes]
MNVLVQAACQRPGIGPSTLIGATGVVTEGEEEDEFVETQFDRNAHARARAAALPALTVMSALSAENPNPGTAAMPTVRGSSDVPLGGHCEGWSCMVLCEVRDEDSAGSFRAGQDQSTFSQKADLVT